MNYGGLIGEYHLRVMITTGTTSRQDGDQFEDCLRRCNALERKLTQQVRRRGQEVSYECGRNTRSLKCQCWKKTGISKQLRTRLAHRQEAAGDSR